MENVLKTKPVGELLAHELEQPKYNFFIPSYQRGYRWDSEQVEDLLNDLFEFIQNKNSKNDKYCLQPIVVKKTPDNKYEVLDGQQRLTTIFILLSRLKKSNSEIDIFSLEYETRKDCEAFLQALDCSINTANPDYYHISNAYKVIDTWLTETKKVKPNISASLFDVLAESVEFIWYEVLKHSDSIDVFTRINIGKILLTNAELVKAIFLSKNNLSIGHVSIDTTAKDFDKILTLKQNAIALDWDNIEKQLENQKFWNFIYPGNNMYETRIDYLLDLLTPSSVSKKYKYNSFKHFYDKVKEARKNSNLLSDMNGLNTSFIEREWKSIKDLYDLLLEWYSDKLYNHLIGFLVKSDVPVIEIKTEFQQKDRNDFITYLKNRIRLLIDCSDLSLLRYGTKSNNEKIERLLLFHNVVNSLQANNELAMFPFEELKNKKWTLEHIYAQNSDELREDDYVQWLQDHLISLQSHYSEPTSQSLIKQIKKMLSQQNSIDKIEFQELFTAVANFIQNKINEIANDESIIIELTANKSDSLNYSWLNDDNSIANLALLDGSTNSSIKNSLFDVKRKLIMEKDKNGSFIPAETKKVFLKYFTPLPKHLIYWTFQDRFYYVTNLQQSLAFLN